MNNTEKFLKTFIGLPTNGWLTEVEARLLWDTVHKTEGPILEVGCYYGRSTVLLAALNRPIYSIDPFKDFDTNDPSGELIKTKFLNNLYVRGITNVQLFHISLEDWPPRPVGFAYLDGDHTAEGTRRQIEKALACNPTHIGVHDVNDHGDGIAIRDMAKSILGDWENRVGRLAVWGIHSKST